MLKSLVAAQICALGYFTRHFVRRSNFKFARGSADSTQFDFENDSWKTEAKEPPQYAQPGFASPPGSGNGVDAGR